MPVVEIMRTGRHTAMSGHEIEFSDDELRAMATAYSPARGRAVLTLGHPADNQPDLGGVEKLTAVDGRLFAHLSNVASKAVDWVRAGLYKHVSASFHAAHSPSNPVPGVPYLRHVGMLGSIPPAVKGMAPLSFAGGGADCLSFAEYDADENSLAGVTLDFAAPPGYSCDPARLAHFRRAREFADVSGLPFLEAAVIVERIKG